ncbi:MAG: ribosome maturation factor RimM [Clostridia bacterium]|nr:ribosome maturation factor RimM [Clostridia bacterium]
MEKILIGKITSAVGIKGEVKVYSYSDYKERFGELKYLYFDDAKHSIKAVRYQKDMAVILFEGVTDRDMAEALRDKDVFIDETQLRVLDEGTYYIRDLIGLDAISTEGDCFGKVKNITQGAAQDIYEIELCNGKMAYIPGVKAFVKEVKLGEYVKFQLIPGMIDEEYLEDK